MKKTISLFLTITMIITVAVVGVVPSYAVDIENTELSYSYNNVTKTLTINGNGAIPDYDDCYDETDNFKECKYPWKGQPYEHLEFGDGVTSIGNFAFCRSSSLKTVTIPDTVTSLGKGAFRSCENLESVTISNTVTGIGEMAFDNCSSLIYVKLPDALETIGNKAFYHCTSLASVTFPDTVKSIGESAFNSTGLTELVCPGELTSIGTSAFSSCGDLKTVTFNDKITEIGLGSFRYCPVEEIVFPESVSVIPSQVFRDCSKLKKVTFSDSVTRIDSMAFLGCKALKSVELPFSVVVIGDKALGYSTTSKKTEDFEVAGYEDTYAKTFAEEKEFKFTSIGKAYSGDSSETVSWVFDKETGSLIIAGKGDMGNCTADKLADYSRFSNMAKSIVIGDGVTSIGDYAFFGFDNPSIVLSECKTLTSIGKYALYNIGKSFYAPSGIKSIGEKAIGQFDNEGKADPEFTITGENFSCAKNYAIQNGFRFILEDGSVPNEGTCGEKATWTFDKETGALTISGEGAMSDYTAESLPEYLYHCISSIVIEQDITEIGAFAFFGTDAVEEIYIQPKIVKIGEKAIGYKFDTENKIVKIENAKISGYDETEAQNYATLNEIEFASKGKYYSAAGNLGETAKWSYDSLEKALVISGTGETTAFTKEAPAEFTEHDIEKVVVEEGITKIGDFGLFGLKNVKEITVANSVETIGENALGYVLNEEEEVQKIDGLTINGYDDSSAVVYATEKEFTFVSLGKFGIKTGKCGENVTWTYDAQAKTLELEGEGGTFDYELDALPEFADFEISNISVAEGITGLGKNIFVSAKGDYERIDCPDTIETAGDNFAGFRRVVDDEEGSSLEPMQSLTIAGYILTPVYGFAKLNNFKFISLDEDITDFDLGKLPVKIDQKNKQILIYSNELDKTAFEENCSAELTEFEFVNGGKFTLTVDEKTFDYTAVFMGDATCDGNVNSSDALEILQHTVGNKTIEGIACVSADLNGDGNINSTDALNILQFTVGLSGLNDYNK